MPRILKRKITINGIFVSLYQHTATPNHPLFYVVGMGYDDQYTDVNIVSNWYNNLYDANIAFDDMHRFIKLLPSHYRSLWSYAAMSLHRLL